MACACACARHVHVHGTHTWICIPHYPSSSAHYMPLQLLHVMKASLLWTRHMNIDFTLGRGWGDVDCFALRPRCATRERCTSADLLRRPWQPPGLEQRDGASEWPPPATYAGPRGAHPMRSSCSDNWFQCHGSHSRMCQEAEAAAAPLDRAAPRALFVACAERACEERPHLKAGGVRCARGRAALTSSYLVVYLKPNPAQTPKPNHRSLNPRPPRPA